MTKGSRVIPLDFDYRPADYQRGHEQHSERVQSGRDQGVREDIQAPQNVDGSDADPGGSGPERDRGASLQPKCHMQVSVPAQFVVSSISQNPTDVADGSPELERRKTDKWEELT